MDEPTTPQDPPPRHPDRYGDPFDEQFDFGATEPAPVPPSTEPDWLSAKPSPQAGYQQDLESLGDLAPPDSPTPPLPWEQPAPYDIPLIAGGYERPTAQPGPPPEPPRRRHYVRWIAAALVIAMVLTAVFSLGRLTSPEPEADFEAVDVTTEAPDDVAAQTIETADTPTATLDNPSSLEPVADIAAAVSPAVVQLDTNAGLGSGVLYSSDGYILTAAHVVLGARTVTVRLATGEAVDGEVVGSHDLTDIAVVKIPGSGYPVAELAIGEEIRVGSLAVALGSPFGLDQTVTAGIVSAVDRSISGVSMVQTDAAINPGNSGGPLVDARGRVIGINDQIFTQSGDNAGIGFAVSIDLAKIVADQLVFGDDVRLSFLGVSSQPSSSDQPGAVVQEVVEGSAAETAGIEVGDIIVAVDGTQVTDPNRLRILIISTAPGSSVDIELIRDGSRLTIATPLGQTPPPTTPTTEAP